MPSIDGVARYVGRVEGQEKLCLEDLRKLIADALGVGVLPLHISEQLTKLRNLSRDVGFMRRVLADMRKREGW
jgi:hypothetical protein